MKGYKKHDFYKLMLNLSNKLDRNNCMKISEIKNPQLKNQIQLAYLYGENKDDEKLNNVKLNIQQLINENHFITVKQSKNFVKIPYGNDGEFVIPIFSDEIELNKGLEYFRLNKMNEGKVPEIVKIDQFKKIKENPKFLGLLINIATVSYIINLDF